MTLIIQIKYRLMLILVYTLKSYKNGHIFQSENLERFSLSEFQYNNQQNVYYMFRKTSLKSS